MVSIPSVIFLNPIPFPELNHQLLTQGMKKAKEQALRYARSLPTSEGWPPFLVVVDVGFCIDLYSDFARQGKIGINPFYIYFFGFI